MTKKTANKEKEIEVGAIVSRSEEFIEKNKKSIIAVIAGIAAVVGLILVYHYMYAKPQAEKAKLRHEKHNLLQIQLFYLLHKL